MSANPFKLMEEVDGKFEVENLETEILYFDDKTNSRILYDKENLSWNIDEIEESLTLDEIVTQIIQIENLDGKIPIIKVSYESGLWGVIFIVGYCGQTDKRWFVHGVTNGYA